MITGTIRDATGEPVAGQAVSVMRYRFNPMGDRSLSSVNGPFGSMTDDRGVYRVFGLAPGDYTSESSSE